MKTVLVVIWGVLFALPVETQQATTPDAKAQHRTTPGAAQATRSSNASSSVDATASPTTVSDADQERIRELTHRIRKLELEMIPRSQESSGNVAYVAIIVAFIAILGAIFGQLLLAWREDRRAAHAAEQAVELAKQEALFRQTEEILEYRLRQMQQFYAPMHALLGQSKALYDKMLHQLAQDEPKRYRWVDPPDPEGYRFHVFDDEDKKWKGFRLLDQLPAVRSNQKALALAVRILEVGEKTTGIISEHAGLASEDLMDVLGKYLAHYAILSTIYKSDETDPYKPGWHEMGYYTRELNEKIEAGYRELSQFFNKYAKAGERMLEDLSAEKGRQQS